LLATDLRGLRFASAADTAETRFRHQA
jgi:hypothetical protein